MKIKSVAEGIQGHPGDRISRRDTMLTRSFKIVDQLGFHARPAAIFVRTLQHFESEIMVMKKGGYSVNGKSIMGLLTLGIQHGEELVVTVKGNDAKETMSAIEKLLDNASSQPEYNASQITPSNETNRLCRAPMF